MDRQAQRDLQLLVEVEKDGGVSQRTLAKKLDLALGLTNLYIRRLAKKGFIKVTTIPRNRIKYLLTPRGVAEKTRLTYLYMQYSLTYYRDMRQRLKESLANVAGSDHKRFVVYGTGELAELAYLTLREMDLQLVGFVSKEGGQAFLSCPLSSVEALHDWKFDTLLIADLQEADSIRDQIRDVVSGDKVITL